jgi:hypothetical protein
VSFRFSLKRFSFREWTALVIFFFVLWYSPYVDFPIRVATIAIGALVLAGALVLVWRFKAIRFTLIFFYIGALVFLAWPASLPKDRADLRASYCNALNSYQGCRYVWGGVGYLGIDCSGFVQKGLEDGLVTNGLVGLNPGLTREALWIYWHRTTAKVLGEGDAGRTFVITQGRALNDLDYSLLMPGDLAVTASGDHVLAYLGAKTWIAADPGEGKVTRFTIPELKNAYFSTPMRIVRWKILSG